MNKPEKTVSRKKREQEGQSSEAKDSESDSCNLEVRMTEVVHLHPEMIKSLIPVFDNKTMTVTNYIARVTQFAVVYGWSDEQKFLYASTRLDGVPKMWYNATCSKINNWKQFAESIKSKFDNSVDAMDVHFKLMNIKKLSTESYVEFAYKVNEIASNNGIAEASAVKYIIAALSADPIYQGIITGRYNTLDDLTTQLNYFEMMTSVSDFKKRNDVATTSKGDIKKPLIRCFKCNEKGHKKTDCPKDQVFKKEVQKVTCNYCKFVGHNEEKCYKKQKDQRIVQSEVNIVQEGEDQGLSKNMKISTSIIIRKSVIQLQGLFDTGSSVSMISKLSLPPGIKWETFNN